MSEVKDVRAILEKLRSEPSVGGNSTAGSIAEAFVSEGLAACDEYDADTLQGARQPDHDESVRLEVFASIPRKAGLLQ